MDTFEIWCTCIGMEVHGGQLMEVEVHMEARSCETNTYVQRLILINS